MHRTVGLVNTDICVSGPIVKPQSSPVLRDVVVESLKHASDPTTEIDRSYYEFWEEWTNLGKMNKARSGHLALPLS